MLYLCETLKSTIYVNNRCEQVGAHFPGSGQPALAACVILGQIQGAGSLTYKALHGL